MEDQDIIGFNNIQEHLYKIANNIIIIILTIINNYYINNNK